MGAVLEKNTVENVIENEQEVALIMERLEEAKSGEVMPLEESIKKFISEKETWKSLV